MSQFVLWFWLFTAPFVLGGVAWWARSTLAEGRRPALPGLPDPGRADVALLEAIGSGAASTDLPECELYLGQADGTVILFVVPSDGTEKRTLRIPASSVHLDIRPGRDAC